MSCSSSRPPKPVSIPTVGSDISACAGLASTLPSRVASLTRAPASQSPGYGALWSDGKSLVQLQCGVARPSELNEVSTLLDVDAVTWFAVPEGPLTRYWAVDRRPYVVVLVPSAVHADDVLVTLGKAVATLPKTAVDLEPNK